ncbi:MAG: hypothetical protein WEE20_12605 [Bacteroidota bacterium]
MELFKRKLSPSAPLIIIKKDADDAGVKEYTSMEEAIADLEQDPNVSHEKIATIRASLKSLKNKTTIRIKNGQILK